MSEFVRDTALSEIGPGHFAAELHSGWWIARGANGGYLAAILVEAMRAEAGSLPLRSVTVHFTGAPVPGPVELTSETLHRGRSLQTRSARMEQAGRLIATAIGAFGAPREGPAFSSRAAPDAPPPAECPRFAGFHAFHKRWEYRWVFGAPPGSKAEDPVVGGWIRSSDPTPANAPYLVAVCDAFSPPWFTTQDRSEIAPIPTIELTIHLRRAVPVAGSVTNDFLLARFASGSAAEGYIDEVGEVWTQDGTLLAECRQLATFLQPKPR